MVLLPLVVKEGSPVLWEGTSGAGADSIVSLDQHLLLGIKNEQWATPVPLDILLFEIIYNQDGGSFILPSYMIVEF